MEKPRPHRGASAGSTSIGSEAPSATNRAQAAFRSAIANQAR